MHSKLYQIEPTVKVKSKFSTYATVHAQNYVWHFSDNTTIDDWETSVARQ